MVKNPPVRETQVRSLCQQGPLEEEVAAHSSVLEGKIPWTKEPEELQSMGFQRVRLTEHTVQCHVQVLR